MLKAVVKSAGFDLQIPLTRLTYAEALRSYGSDKPDLRLPGDGPFGS